MYCDDQENNEPDYTLLTKKVAVSEFGDYVEQLHANGNNNFREQFFVSLLFNVMVDIVPHSHLPLSLQWLPGREEDHQTTCAHHFENKSRNRFINATVCKSSPPLPILGKREAAEGQLSSLTSCLL